MPVTKISLITSLVFGPYFNGKNNDVDNFLKWDLKRLRTCLPSNIVFIVDRGFQDSLGLLEDLGFVSKMPHFL